MGRIWKIKFCIGIALLFMVMEVFLGSTCYPEEIKSYPVVEEEFCFDLNDSQGMLRKLKDHPLLEKQLATCQERVSNLEQQSLTNKELIQVYEERRKLDDERIAFYREMVDAERKLNDRYGATIEKMRKAEERKGILETIKSVLLFIGGVFIGHKF